MRQYDPYPERRATAAALVSTVAASVQAPLIICPSTLSRMVTHVEELQCRGGNCRTLPGPAPAVGAAVGLTGGARAAGGGLEASAAMATPRACQADQTHRLPRSHRSGIESLQARASATDSLQPTTVDLPQRGLVDGAHQGG